MTLCWHSATFCAIQKTLRRLEMKYIQFTKEGSGNFVDGLQSNNGTLQELDMGQSAFGKLQRHVIYS
jgi:hypothetical protein